MLISQFKEELLSAIEEKKYLLPEEGVHVFAEREGGRKTTISVTITTITTLTSFTTFGEDETIEKSISKFF